MKSMTRILKSACVLLGISLVVGCGGGGTANVERPLEVVQKRATDNMALAPDAAHSATSNAREVAHGETRVMSELKQGTTTANGNFESGSTGWSESSTGGYRIISNFTQYPAYSGSWYAWLGGYDSGTDVLSQDLTVPSSGTAAKLQFRYHISTAETSTSTAWDKLSVDLVDPASGAVIRNLANLSNLNETSGWTLSPEYDLTAYAGRAVRLKFTALLDGSSTTAFRIDDVSVFPVGTASGAVSTVSNCSNLDAVSGWWWNPSESGRGFAVERQGNQLFTAAFLYEDDGLASWYVSQMTQVGSSATYSGTVTRHSGGQTLLGSYRSPTATVQVGVATLTFADTRNATLGVRFNDGTEPVNIALQRFPISSPSFAASQAAFQSGWWWNENEGGRGYFIEVQGSVGFVGAFMYDVSGQPTWYVSSANVRSANATGSLQQFAGGQTLSGAYRNPYANGTAGQLAFNFTSTNTGVMTLPNGAAVALKRFGFNPASPPNADCTPVSSGTTGTTGTTTASLASFSGTYSVSGAGASGSFTVNTTGAVTRCSVGTIVQCSGQLALSGSNAIFNISGNDGESPVDTRATLNGTITAAGSVSGTVSGTSASEGPFSGALSGSRTSGGSSSTGGGTTAAGLTGTWCTDAAGNQNCWVFDNETGSSNGKFYQQSINEYSGTLTNTMTWSVNPSAGTLTYSFTRSTLSNSAYNYDKAVNLGPYTFAYTVTGTTFRFQGIDFNKR